MQGPCFQVDFDAFSLSTWFLLCHMKSFKFPFECSLTGKYDEEQVRENHICYKKHSHSNSSVKNADMGMSFGLIIA